MKKDFDILTVFEDRWALATAGTLEDYNTCTIGWGSLGTVWGKSTATIYINELRYTNEYVQKNDYFTISFFP
ncbi:MAG: hypothetical protein K5634_06520 [Sphaerochaetaceae bacterium]|nr:hypothetical protein [Sphaerochaetaceae bacterium]